jgi:hypothetical protein
MLDDLTFALRYESTILIRIALLGWEIPLPITRETVEEMKRCGWWEVFGDAIGPYVDHIQIEGEHGFGKPEEQAYTHAMEVLGVGPHETWMVGDNLEWEIVAPQRLGVYAIWHDGYGVGLPPTPRSGPTASSAAWSELLL